MERKSVTIGQMLHAVAETGGATETLRKLIPQIQEHPEEKMLRAMLREAIQGKHSVPLGKTLPPESLFQEGIVFLNEGNQIVANF